MFCNTFGQLLFFVLINVRQWCTTQQMIYKYHSHHNSSIGCTLQWDQSMDVMMDEVIIHYLPLLASHLLLLTLVQTMYLVLCWWWVAVCWCVSWWLGFWIWQREQWVQCRLWVPDCVDSSAITQKIYNIILWSGSRIMLRGQNNFIQVDLTVESNKVRIYSMRI